MKLKKLLMTLSLTTAIFGLVSCGSDSPASPDSGNGSIVEPGDSGSTETTTDPETPGDSGSTETPTDPETPGDSGSTDTPSDSDDSGNTGNTSGSGNRRSYY